MGSRPDTKKKKKKDAGLKPRRYISEKAVRRDGADSE